MNARKHFSIGVDFGTLSARAILIDTDDGREVAEATSEYAHGVIDCALPTGKLLSPLWALQDPRDYLDALKAVIGSVLADSGIAPIELAGVGIDFTTCTLLAVDENGLPLSFDEKFRHNPHAYVKLWKHHAAQPDADRFTEVAVARGERFLARYGGQISCEWMFPKILQMLREAPEVFDATYRFVEAGDWIAWMLTGNENHSASFAGYKGFWDKDEGYPSDEYFTAVHPALHGIVGSKVSDKITPLDERAGVVSAKGSALSSIPEGVAVALSVPDAHAALPGLNVTSPGSLLAVIGTSTCFFVHTKEAKEVRGVSGMAKDGVLPGLCTYESGQAAVGDIFDWFVKNGLPARYEDEAKARGMKIHALLREKAAKLSPGESGLLALDWLNGNRCPLSDGDLSGLILGLDLQTKPEEIYRAWLEATAFGARSILDNFEKYGIHFDSVTAAGGIARKDPLLMQIYADVFGKEITVTKATQAGALGSAVYGAVAGGVFATVYDAAKTMAPAVERVYRPDPEAHRVYEKLYRAYLSLQEIFGKRGSVMKKLIEIKRQ